MLDTDGDAVMEEADTEAKDKEGELSELAATKHMFQLLMKIARTTH